jgi:hypothetical protein
MKRRRRLLATCVALLAPIAASAQVESGRVEPSSRSVTIAHATTRRIVLWPGPVRDARPPRCEATASPAPIPLLPMLGSLSLTGAQLDRVSAILRAQVPALRESERIARLASIEVRRLTNSGSFDPSKAEAVAEVGARALRDASLLRADAERRIRALLTEGQQRQLQALRWSGGPPCSEAPAMRLARTRIERPHARRWAMAVPMETQ